MYVAVIHADSRARLSINFTRTCKGMKSKVSVSGPFFNCVVVLQEKRERVKEEEEEEEEEKKILLMNCLKVVTTTYIYGLSTKSEINMVLDIGLVLFFFCVFMDLNPVSVHKYAKTNNDEANILPS